MFLTRSIRRKLCIVLSIFVGLLALLFGAGFMGLLSYGSMVSEIEKNLRASPKRYEILAATSRLMDPTLRRDAFALSRLLVDLESAMSEYRLQQVKLPNSPENRGQSSIAFAILQKMDNDIARMKDKLPALESQQIAYVAQQEMTESLASLQKSALSLPNPIEGLQKLWQDSRSTYQICFWMLIGVAVCTLLAIGIVTHLSIRWIFFPIKELHRGATKVARGDFSVRVQLKGQDEIVDLAHALNAMTQRFCEIKADLDRQVNERSRQLVRSERLAGVGFLAAGVAHEINNPLSAISMASESLASRVAGSEGTGLTISADDADVARQYLEMIQTEAARCQEITSRLLNFARGQDAPRGRQDVTRIIHDVVQMVGHMGKYSGHHIEFVPTSAVHAEINGSEIKQVILNLVANSLESMGTSGGRLAIEVKELSDEICLTFTDTGCGMTARVLENLFEPFFTERKSGRGTGLGLSISHRIVTDHGGRIEAQSDGPGQGSTFRVHLPKRASQSMAA
ncbi:MAG: hypothetical protein C0478_12890 [Planctomyces sp.]|nr:hypothetical protein [Planctomyces sp.]